MRPRSALALALLALLGALAGCADPAGSLSMEPVDDESLADSASRAVPATNDAPDGSRAAVVEDAIANGTATTSDERPPVEPGLPYRHDGSYYDLSYTEVGTEPGYSAGIEVDLNASSVEGTTIAYEDLPDVDRRAVEGLVTLPRRNLEPGYDIGIGVTYDEEEASQSVLLPDQEYDAVEYEGETYPINVRGVESATLTTYRYEATVVAESAEAYAASLKEQYAFELTGLSDNEESVVEGALNDTYYPDDTDDEGFGSLVDRFRTHEAVESDEYSGSWVVRYDGTLYWVEMDFGQFVTDDDPVTKPDDTPPPDA